MKSKLILLIISFWIGSGLGLIGCNGKSSQESALAPNVVPNLTQERNNYIPVELEKIPADIPLTGANPREVALAVFGFKDVVEDNFQEELTTNTKNPDQVIITLTQNGLPDDSIRAIRYRLEFIPKDNQWQLIWAGRQQMCQPGRGSQEWTNEQCS